MARYIDADALINELSASCMPIDDREISGLFDCDESIRDIIGSMPTADVRPERHGLWSCIGDYFLCSECDGGSLVKYRFCMHCGAMMMD